MESQQTVVTPYSSEGTVLSTRDKRNLASKQYKAKHRDAIKEYNKTYYANKKIAKLLEATQPIEHPLVDLVRDVDNPNTWVRGVPPDVVDLTGED